MRYYHSAPLLIFIQLFSTSVLPTHFFCVYFFISFLYILFFFFSSRRRHTRCLSDWSSDVCSSDLSPQDAAAAFRSAGTSRKRDRADGYRRKPASNQTACRKKRSNRSAAASRPAAPSKRRSSSAASANRRCARLPARPAGPAGTWARTRRAP